MCVRVYVYVCVYVSARESERATESFCQSVSQSVSQSACLFRCFHIYDAYEMATRVCVLECFRARVLMYTIQLSHRLKSILQTVFKVENQSLMSCLSNKRMNYLTSRALIRPKIYKKISQFS